MHKGQLISYIALGAPATRRPSEGELPFLRPEIGFTPKWYHQTLGIDFGERYHTDPSYRRESLLAMRQEMDSRFPGARIGKINDTEQNPDLLTGLFGACTIASMFGVPIRYAEDQWPTSEHFNISDDAMRGLEPVNPAENPFFRSILEQVDWIASTEGKVMGFINWQGVLNNAQRIRGQQLFLDMLTEPETTMHFLDCITTTMIDAAKLLQKRQRVSGFDYSFFTVSNCLVNMLSPDLYHEFILPFDKKIADSFQSIGIHNCAWNADPYLEDYSLIPGVSYLDMGIGSDLSRARALFPEGRRSIMYTPMDLAGKSLEEIRKDLEYIAFHYGPCDIVAADIEAGTPDGRVIDFIGLCDVISGNYIQ